MTKQETLADLLKHFGMGRMDRIPEIVEMLLPAGDLDPITGNVGRPAVDPDPPLSPDEAARMMIPMKPAVPAPDPSPVRHVSLTNYLSDDLTPAMEQFVNDDLTPAEVKVIAESIVPKNKKGDNLSPKEVKAIAEGIVPQHKQVMKTTESEERLAADYYRKQGDRIQPNPPVRPVLSVPKKAK